MKKEINSKFLIGIIVLLLASFGCLNTAYAGELGMRVKSFASDSLGKIGFTRASNYLKTDLGVSSFINKSTSSISGGMNYIRNGVTGGMWNISSRAVKAGSGIGTFLANSGYSFSNKFLDLSNHIGKSTGFWNVKPKVVEVKNRNAATILTTMSSRTEYFVTNKSTNKTSQINESEFKRLMGNNGSPTNIK